jgi:hypothetical protein
VVLGKARLVADPVAQRIMRERIMEKPVNELRRAQVNVAGVASLHPDLRRLAVDVADGPSDVDFLHDEFKRAWTRDVLDALGLGVCMDPDCTRCTREEEDV